MKKENYKKRKNNSYIIYQKIVKRKFKIKNTLKPIKNYNEF